ncbi:MAG: putative acetyltransferase [Chloroflexi bacterium]|nr:putative acetyltransferase [Chloroflexota bacterium]
MIGTARRVRVAYAYRRIRQLGVVNLLRGLYVRHQFSSAGILSVRAGWPLPKVHNMGGSVAIGNCSLFPGVRIECWKGASVNIGNGTYINRNTEIVAAQSVFIGRDCKIARDVLIMDTDQHPVGSAPMVHGPVKIGDRVWVGSRVIVLKGVSIGHDSIIGAGAIVTKSIPPHSVVVGQAARVVRTLCPEGGPSTPNDELHGTLRA